MPGIGVIVNPRARHNRDAEGRVRRFAALLGEDGVVRAPGSLAELDESVGVCRDRGIEILAVCGGDGSYFRALSALIRAFGNRPLPAFLPLRAGSMNTVARSVGWASGDPADVLATVVRRYRAGRPFSVAAREVVSVNGAHYGFMVGAAAVVRFVEEYYRRAGRGPGAAARVLAQSLVSGLVGGRLGRRILQTVPATVTCDGQRLSVHTFNFVYVSVLADIGLGLRATARAGHASGYLQLLAGSITAGEVLSRLPRLRRGAPLGIASLHDAEARQVRVEFQQPTAYMIDGDIFEAVRVLDLRVGPRLDIIRQEETGCVP